MNKKIFRQMMLSVLIVGATFSRSKTERNCLLRLGIQDVRVCESAGQALKQIEERRPDLIFCNEKLADMCGRQFIDLLQIHPELRHLPSILILMQTNESVARPQLAAALLTRPYSLQDMQTALQRALQWAMIQNHKLLPTTSQRDFEKALAALALTPAEEKIETPSLDDLRKKASEKLTAARLRLKYEQPGAALAILNSFLWPEERFCAEAALLISEAWEQKGFPERRQHYLQQAGRHFAAINDLDRVTDIFAELQRIAPASKNPYQDLGAVLLAERDYSGAGKAYLRSLRLTPKREELIKTISRDCLFSDDPPQYAHKLCKDLAGKMGLPKEIELFQQIIGISPTKNTNGPISIANENENSRFNRTMLFLQTIFSVVGHTSLSYLKGNIEKIEEAI